MISYSRQEQFICPFCGTPNSPEGQLYCPVCENECDEDPEDEDDYCDIGLNL